MTLSDTISIPQVAELLAHNGYDVAELASGVIRVRDPHSGVSFQAALEGNVLYMSVNLTSVPDSRLTPELLRRLLSGENGISTSSFRLYDAAGGKVTVTLNNFCTLQDMGPEDHDDILSLAGYLMADIISARRLLQSAIAN